MQQIVQKIFILLELKALKFVDLVRNQFSFHFKLSALFVLSILILNIKLHVTFKDISIKLQL